MPLPYPTRDQIAALQTLSPFELKAALGALAGEHERRTAFQMLNAGRGNPNFVATTPREAFFALGEFALEECRRTNEWDAELAGIPTQDGISERFRAWLQAHPKTDGAGISLLRRLLDHGVNEYGFNPDAFVWELADSIIGDHYPEPDRMLTHAEKIVHEYLVQEMGGPAGFDGTWDLFAVEGGTAAMCYIFDTLSKNRLLSKGDRIAIMVPVFTPYLEIPQLEEYDFDCVYLNATSMTEDHHHTWQFPDEELDKLRDPSIKALFVVNPTNPPSVRLADSTLAYVKSIVAHDNPGLIVITDDVYGTFINGFRSLMAEIPRNTIGVYSFSKYFGATGWRLGVIAVGEDNIFDEALAALPETDRQHLDRRYSTLTLHPERIKFVDRLVADSRSVALNHTAGLSLPQQCQMLLFSAYCLLDTDNTYKAEAQRLLAGRLNALLEGLRIELPEDPLRVGYYIELDLILWAEASYGPKFAEWMRENYEPTDILFRLAEQTGIVALNGGGFAGPAWSIRISIANLADEQYHQIGASLRAVGDQYVDEWRGK
ncbi:aspartate 4-decarboxylase [Nocardioides lianchengensis]|uniref:Aminotransferase n=1 Tax=Nocardioides lianchengensis TaxID=1045774 RepID=A0A1G7C236_9ACTN|nr:aspartate 4-decarboxylase [Nocardioides lianchengensis]NYG09268.1 aspartate 4-decarboxylase [Nocardioides lianchengensis]SDE33408.1 aspartate 4-decarboxylase [Nocardioides lianchengensis]